MYRPKRTTWFLIADGTRARLFESPGWKEPWTLIDTQEDEAARAPDRELASERPGRGIKFGSGAHYGVETVSEHDKAEKAFIEDQAQFLNAAEQRGDFDQLVLAAPPRALGALRAKLTPEVIARCIGVFDKDLAKTPEKELEEYFKQRLERW